MYSARIVLIAQYCLNVNMYFYRCRCEELNEDDEIAFIGYVGFPIT